MDLSSGAEDGGVGVTRSCASSGNSGGGSTPDDVAEVVGIGPVSSSTTKLTNRRLGGSGGANVHRCHRRSIDSVTPLQQLGGIVWAEAAVRDVLEGCVLALEVGDVLL